MVNLTGKTILITGSARRIGRHLALAVAGAGADVVIHHGKSADDAESVRTEIENLGRRALVIQGDLANETTPEKIIRLAWEFAPLFGLVNNAAIFQNLDWENTTARAWQEHLSINLTAPFLLSQAFARQIKTAGGYGRIVNLLDWRALRPAADHLPYTVSKVGLYGLTKSMASALAPKITVNGMALGAVLPPADGGYSANIIKNVPAQRWAEMDEVSDTLLFLLGGPTYITGEVIHVDGGRHLI